MILITVFGVLILLSLVNVWALISEILFKDLQTFKHNKPIVTLGVINLLCGLAFVYQLNNYNF